MKCFNETLLNILANMFYSTFLVVTSIYLLKLLPVWGCYPRCTCRSSSNIACTQISDKPFKQIPDFLTKTNYEIRQITIKNQNIQVLSPTTRNALNFVPFVEQLTITESNVTFLEPHVFNAGFRRFQTLDLSKNYISYVPSAAFYGLQNATVISLAKNSISSIDENFFGTYSLRPWDGNLVIKLNENRLSTFPGNFVKRIEAFMRLNTPTTTRVTIDLSENPIKCDCSINWLVSSVFTHVEIVGTCNEITSFSQVKGTSLKRLKQDSDTFKECNKVSLFDFNLLSMQTLLMTIGALTVVIIILICFYNRVSECLYERKMRRYSESRVVQSSAKSQPNYSHDISLI